MKFLLTTLILLVFAKISYTQNSNNHDFVGFLITSAGQRISFKLTTNELKGEAFTGYSVTDYEGDDQTKSLVTGGLSLLSKKMSFKETGNLETVSVAEASSFCYINASNLIIQKVGDKNLVTGEFKGFFPSGEVCATGTVLLVNKDLVEDTIKEKEVIVDEPEPLEEINNSKSSDLVMTSNEELLVNKWGDRVFLEIWDGNVQDNDSISVYLNDGLIKENLVLTRKVTKISLPATKDQFKVKIVALNEGRFGINTLNLRLRNTADNNQYVSKLNKGESFTVNFKED